MAAEKFVLAIDQGTTNTKALLVDRAGSIRSRASRPLAIAFPHPGWVEQDARELWSSVTEAIDDCLTQAGLPAVDAVGVTNQRESVVVWDRKTGKPAGPCITWQCRRTAPFCEELTARGLSVQIRQSTGLPVDPLFSASKARWLIGQARDGPARAAAGELCVGTVDSWLLWNLTGGKAHATDASNASRTQLLNLRRCEWDDELLSVFEVPRKCLPEVKPSSGSFGLTSAAGLLPAGLPVASLVGDSHAALFGHAAFHPGAVKATYGTGSSLMSPTAAPMLSAHGLSTTVAWWRGGEVRYALEGNITNTGGSVQWLAGLLGLSGGAEAVAALAAETGDSGGVYVVPAFAGLGAPHWDAGARGLIYGLTRGSSAAHVAKATIDSIAYQIADVFGALQLDAALEHPALFADGGASRNDGLMQFQADILGYPVIRNSSTDLSAIGAAWMAGLATGYWSSLDELETLPRDVFRFEPRMDASCRGRLVDGWRDALSRSMSCSHVGGLK